MWDVKPGDLVVFVGWPSDCAPAKGPEPDLGAIYTVRTIRADPSSPDGRQHRGVYIGVEEITGHILALRGFRPVTKPSIEVFQRLLAPTPADVKELQDAQ